MFCGDSYFRLFPNICQRFSLFPYFDRREGNVILNKVKALCAEKNISIAKLEKECGIGSGTICAWDKSLPRIDTLQKVARYFNKPIEYFLEEDEAAV